MMHVIIIRYFSPHDRLLSASSIKKSAINVKMKERKKS